MLLSPIILCHCCILGYKQSAFISNSEIFTVLDVPDSNTYIRKAYQSFILNVSNHVYLSNIVIVIKLFRFFTDDTEFKYHKLRIEVDILI